MHCKSNYPLQEISFPESIGLFSTGSDLGKELTQSDSKELRPEAIANSNQSAARPAQQQDFEIQVDDSPSSSQLSFAEPNSEQSMKATLQIQNPQSEPPEKNAGTSDELQQIHQKMSILALSSLPSQPSRCEFCFDDLDFDKEDLKCSGCSGVTHRACYPQWMIPSPSIKKDEFLCMKCSLHQSSQCFLCMKGERLLVLLTSGIWAHPSCVQLMTGLTIADSQFCSLMDFTEGLSTEPLDLESSCSFCLGPPVKYALNICHWTNCSRAFHIPCALSNETILPALLQTGLAQIQTATELGLLSAYCPFHKEASLDLFKFATRQGQRPVMRPVLSPPRAPLQRPLTPTKTILKKDRERPCKRGRPARKTNKKILIANPKQAGSQRRTQEPFVDPESKMVHIPEELFEEMYRSHQESLRQVEMLSRINQSMLEFLQELCLDDQYAQRVKGQFGEQGGFALPEEETAEKEKTQKDAALPGRIRLTQACSKDKYPPRMWSSSPDVDSLAKSSDPLSQAEIFNHFRGEVMRNYNPELPSVKKLFGDASSSQSGRPTMVPHTAPTTAPTAVSKPPQSEIDMMVAQMKSMKECLQQANSSQGSQAETNQRRLLQKLMTQMMEKESK